MLGGTAQQTTTAQRPIDCFLRKEQLRPSTEHIFIKMPMHVRLKRKNQTMFLHVDPADNFFQLKTRVGEIHNIEPEKIQILGPDKVTF